MDPNPNPSRSPRGRKVRGLVLGMAAVVLAGCADVRAEGPLRNAEPSREALVRSVLDALERHDTTAIRELRVTREEYETLLWPSLPDRHQMPFAFAWSVTEPRSRKALREVMFRLGGVPIELRGVDFEKEAEIYPDFTLHRGAVVTGRRRDTGEEGRLTFFDVFVEYGGQWKLLDIDEL